MPSTGEHGEGRKETQRLFDSRDCPGDSKTPAATAAVVVPLHQVPTVPGATIYYPGKESTKAAFPTPSLSWCLGLLPHSPTPCYATVYATVDSGSIEHCLWSPQVDDHKALSVNCLLTAAESHKKTDKDGIKNTYLIFTFV